MAKTKKDDAERMLNMRLAKEDLDKALQNIPDQKKLLAQIQRDPYAAQFMPDLMALDELDPRLQLPTDMPDYKQGMGYHPLVEGLLDHPNIRFTDAELRKIVSNKNLSPDEMEELIKASLRLSLGPGMDINKIGGFSPQGSAPRIGKVYPLSTEPIVGRIPVDKNREITIRKGTGIDEGVLSYAAEADPTPREIARIDREIMDLEKSIKDGSWRNKLNIDPDFGFEDDYNPMKELDRLENLKKQRMEIAHLSLRPTGSIKFINASPKAVVENTMPRLLVEAVSRGQVPHSSNLLPAGQKFVQRMAEQTRTSDVKNMIKKFIDAGKIGELWSVALPIIKANAGPIAAKGLAAGATAGISALVNAAEKIADTPSANEGAKQALEDYEREEDFRRARQKSIKQNPMMAKIFEEADEEIKSYGVKDLINPDEDPNKPKLIQAYPRIRKILK